jgi:hypothetical protein
MTLPGNRAPHLDSLLQPASVAVVGARDDTSRARFDIGSLEQVAEGALQVFAESAGLDSLDLNPVVINEVGATIVDAKATPRVAREVRA